MILLPCVMLPMLLCFEQKNGQRSVTSHDGGRMVFWVLSPNSGTHTTWKWNHVFMFDMVIRISIIILIIIIIIITGIKFCWKPMILKQRKLWWWWWWLSVQWSLRIHHHNPTTTVCIRKYLHELDCLKMHAVSVAPPTINNMFLNCLQT